MTSFKDKSAVGFNVLGFCFSKVVDILLAQMVLQIQKGFANFTVESESNT
jgi:hypothetical protein